jgi:hypothetical protein
MMLIIQVCNRLSKRLDTRRRPILTPSHRDINVLRTFKGALNVIVDFGRALPKVGPLVRVVEESMLVGTLGTPDHTGGSAGGV